ncbi:MAG: hypothetical protein NT057_00935, partial [Actinobacteria bacterium]|nr:hypothetical protein [Actinomycetota bacterium]
TDQSETVAGVAATPSVVFFLRSAIWVDLRISWSCSEQRLALYYVRHLPGGNVVLWGREF